MPQAKGKLNKRLEKQQISDKLTKQTIILEVVNTKNDKYNQFIPFELINDRVGIADNIQIGSEITVDYDLRGREYNGKYYVNLNAWKVESLANNYHNESVPF